jgi:S1-C subfamily serine protease
MKTTCLARFTLIAALTSLAGVAVASELSAPAKAANADGADLSKMVAEKAPAIVSIKFILKGGEQDEEVETTGFVIDPAGLILSSNNAFGGLMARFGGPTPTPTDIKVLIGDDTQGVEAKFFARDSELGLAWVQLTTPPAKPLATIDLSKSAAAKLGEPIFEIALMGKFFDRAPSVSTGNVAAVVKKPRELVIPSIGLASGEMGMPVFNNAGELVGVTTLILPDQEEMSGSPNAVRTAMRGITGGMILPASEVVAATARAKETAAKAPAPTPAAAEPKKDEAPKADK